jgi:hypothetical protein
MIMTTLRALYHLMRADFLERIRRYSFLIVLVATGFAGYSMVPSIDAPYNAFAIGPHRPFYSSAWVGTVFGLVVTTLVSLIGFYLVRTAVARDYRTRVGQIIATTPVSKPLYMLGKWLSNLAVLGAILGVLTVVALVMQLVRAEDTHVNLWALVAPIWFMGLPILALVAAVAVLFECLPLLRSGIGSVVYLFLWGFVLLAGTGSSFDSIDKVTPGNDLIGFTRTMADVRDNMISLGYDPTEGVTDLYQPTGGSEVTRFAWDGIDWTFRILLERLLWVGLAAVIALVAVIPFDRFDPARSRLRVRKKRKKSKKRRAKAEAATAEEVSVAADAAARLDLSSLDADTPRSRIWSTFIAEFRLMVRGQPWLWYGAALGLIVTCLVTPYWVFQKFFFPLVWLWPIFLWSAMGNQEIRHRTHHLVFSCAHLVRRQLPASWLAGVVVAAAVGSGAAVRFLVTGEMYSLFGWVVGVAFVPALALALGIWTNSGRIFEIVYFLIWLLAVYSRGRVWPLDFLARSDQSVALGIPAYYLALTAGLLALAVAGRHKQITTSLR